MDKNRVQEVSVDSLSEEERAQHAKDYKTIKETTDYVANGISIPAAPKRGEVLHCRECKREMLPNTDAFSENPTLRKQQFKWQICDRCWGAINDLVDRSTPGLLAGRS